jgi:hypothetical protein
LLGYTFIEDIKLYFVLINLFIPLTLSGENH